MLLLTTTATIMQMGIHRIRESTIIVPTMFALINITAYTHTHTIIIQREPVVHYLPKSA